MHGIFSRLSRRQFITSCAAALSVLGMEHKSVFDVAEAVEKIAANKVPVFWISAQTCGGCSASAMNSVDPVFSSLILNSISLRIHPEFGGLGSSDIFSEIEKAYRSKYILIVDGSVPIGEDDRLCIIGHEDEKPVLAGSIIKKLGQNASAVIAAGTCASFGGINRNDNKTVTGVRQGLGLENVINIPGCPPHPDWMVLTLLHLIMEGKPPALDSKNRPEVFFGRTIHDQCQRLSAFNNGDFADSSGKYLDNGFCLYKLGCKGPMTLADCPSRLWNEGTSWCVASGGICVGCTQPEFMRDLAPLHQKLPDVSIPGIFGTRASADAIGAVLGGIAAISIAIHFMGGLFSGRFRNEQGNDDNGKA